MQVTMQVTMQVYKWRNLFLYWLVRWGARNCRDYCLLKIEIILEQTI